MAETSDMQRQLEELIGLNADVELQFNDGSLPCNSMVLSMFSSVLRGAVEAHTAGSNASSSDSPRCRIPMERLTREQWMGVASFLYPVLPAPYIRDLQQAEVLLEAGKRYGLSLVLDKVDKYLAGSVFSMVKTADSPANIWKWIKLADQAGLQECMPVLMGRAVGIDKSNCSTPNLQGLSAASLQCMIEAFAGTGTRGAHRHCTRCSGQRAVVKTQSETCCCCRNPI